MAAPGGENHNEPQALASDSQGGSWGAAAAGMPALPPQSVVLVQSGRRDRPRRPDAVRVRSALVTRRAVGYGGGLGQGESNVC
jgi:hypothetical protein